MKSLINNCVNFLKYAFRNNIIIGRNAIVSKSNFEGFNKIYRNTHFINSKIGKGSYIGEDGRFSNVIIGRYCSIGNQVTVVTSTHPSNTFVSTHPAFFSIAKQGGYTYVHSQKFKEHKYCDVKKQISVIIGNDVWIGNGVMIMGGVNIGDGAIIGSRALVTKDVLPFSIVGGVPAKEIGKRFEEDKVQSLLKIKWWEKDDNWVKSNIDLFTDIDSFLNYYENNIDQTTTITKK
jgi:acetyltransferase-like isoleucine patch superfamily enzyme